MTKLPDKWHGFLRLEHFPCSPDSFVVVTHCGDEVPLSVDDAQVLRLYLNDALNAHYAETQRAADQT